VALPGESLSALGIGPGIVTIGTDEFDANSIRVSMPSVSGWAL